MTIRNATADDLSQLTGLYREVARISQGIARMEDELSELYISNLYQHISQQGLMLVAIDAQTSELVAEMHAAKYGLRIFDHILTNLTIVVKPSHQGRGIGKALFTAFLTEVDTNWPQIGRIELESRATNQPSIGLYQSLGFVQEGRMVNKTRNADGRYEDSLLFARTKLDFSFA